LLESTRREHSTKSDEVRDLIAEFFKPNLEKIELFARTTVDEWAAWGNETDKFNAVDEHIEKKQKIDN
jgi:N6-adenosine-specific RNA methylase IME4